MKSARSRRQGPVVLPAVLPAKRGKRRRSAREGVLGAEALDAPVPGRLLVLLSRLHRSERNEPGPDESGR